MTGSMDYFPEQTVTVVFTSLLARQGGVEMKKFTIALLILPAILFAEDILFQDDFSDGNADGWIAMFGEGSYFVNDSLRYDVSYTGTGYVYPCVVRGDSSSVYMTENDYSVLLETVIHSPSQYAGVYARGTFDETGYVLWLRNTLDDVSIFRHDGQSIYTAIGSVYFPLDYDTHYWMRFQCEGGLLCGKVWQGDVGDEPADWLLSVFDYTYDNYGFTGFVTGRYSTSPGSSHSEFDNVVVTTVTPGAIEQITWAGIKTTF